MPLVASAPGTKRCAVWEPAPPRQPETFARPDSARDGPGMACGSDPDTSLIPYPMLSNRRKRVKIETLSAIETSVTLRVSGLIPSLSFSA